MGSGFHRNEKSHPEFPGMAIPSYKNTSMPNIFDIIVTKLTGILFPSP